MLIVAASPRLIFNPYAQIRSQIQMAANTMSSYFDDVDAAFTKGKSIKRAVRGKQIEAAMRHLLGSSRLAGFQYAAQYTKKPMPANYGKTIRKESESHAEEVNRLMKRTTKRRLRGNPDSEYALSSERALAAAKYEAAGHYFKGVIDGFRNSGYGKMWMTSAGESCQDCLDNEDDDVIDVDDEFSSGDLAPAAHLNCDCYLSVRKY